MLRTLSIVAGLLAASAFSCLSAQSLQAPQWANVPFTERGRIPDDIRAFCVDGVTYAFADVVEYKDYIFPKDGPVVRREVELPKQSGQRIYSAFCVVGNTPCVLYTARDKSSAVVSLYLQAFGSSNFAPEGPPMKLVISPSRRPTMVPPSAPAPCLHRTDPRCFSCARTSHKAA